MPSPVSLADRPKIYTPVTLFEPEASDRRTHPSHHKPMPTPTRNIHGMNISSHNAMTHLKTWRDGEACLNSGGNDRHRQQHLPEGLQVDSINTSQNRSLRSHPIILCPKSSWHTRVRLIYFLQQKRYFYQSINYYSMNESNKKDAAWRDWLSDLLLRRKQIETNIFNTMHLFRSFNHCLCRGTL